MKTFSLLMFILFVSPTGFGQATPDLVCSSKMKVCSIDVAATQPKSNVNEQGDDFFSLIFDARSWPARWHCGVWTPFHGWLYIISDVTIGLSYFMIPLILWFFLYKRKQRTPFRLVIILFTGLRILPMRRYFGGPPIA
jgi:hypothetical protein